MHKMVFFILIGVICLSGCASVTPGDAARRGGHYAAAAELYKAGAEQGDPVAAYKLGELYDSSLDGLPKDLSQAIFWYKRSAELGDAKGQYIYMQAFALGNDYTELQDYQNAKIWYEKGAEEVHHYSIYNLAGLYADDKIRPRDDITGLMWLEIVTIMAASYDNPNEGHKYILADSKGFRKKLTDRMTKEDSATAKSKAQTWLDDKKKQMVSTTYKE